VREKREKVGERKGKKETLKRGKIGKFERKERETDRKKEKER
jgi:hypothetical protein